jgi:L-ribulose-5-phosphate 4-epimerase
VPLMFPELRDRVLRANLGLVRAGLVTLSFGNASGVDRDAGVLVIKPSGVPYDELRAEDLVVVSLEDGRRVEGELRPSSDTPTHLLLYRRFPEIGGVVHVTRQMLATEVAGEYEAETGAVIVETLEGLGLGALEMPAVLVASHGPFAWGRDPQDAVDNAIALEAVAAMAAGTLTISPKTGPMVDYLRERHFRRKHGPDAYYGQKSR